MYIAQRKVPLRRYFKKWNYLWTKHLENKRSCSKRWINTANAIVPNGKT